MSVPTVSVPDETSVSLSFAQACAFPSLVLAGSLYSSSPHADRAKAKTTSDRAIDARLRFMSGSLSGLLLWLTTAHL